jgi:hypothetical protein
MIDPLTRADFTDTEWADLEACICKYHGPDVVIDKIGIDTEKREVHYTVVLRSTILNVQVMPNP